MKLIGPHSVIGRSVVVKAGEDDLGRVSSWDCRRRQKERWWGWRWGGKLLGDGLWWWQEKGWQGWLPSLELCLTRLVLLLLWLPTMVLVLQGGHELSLTTGNAGPRIAGGVIGIAQS